MVHADHGADRGIYSVGLRRLNARTAIQCFQLLFLAATPGHAPHGGQVFSQSLGAEKKVDREDVIAEIGTVFGDVDLLIEVADLSSLTRTRSGDAAKTLLPCVFT